MKQLSEKLRRYDKYLQLKGRINGEKKIIRQSPFNRSRQHDIITLKNQFPGAYLIRKIMMMDSQRHNFIESTIRHNEKIRKQGDRDNREMSREVATFMKENEKIVI